MRFGSVIMAYFLIGAVMWGGGAISWGNTGLAGQFIASPGGGGSATQVNQSTTAQLQRTGGPIQEAVQSIGGSGLLAVWNLLAGLIGYLFWPIGVLVTVNAPPRLVVVFGGALVIGFFAGFIRLVRRA